MSEKKPIHKVTLALWVLAAFVFIAYAFYMGDDMRVHYLLEAKFPNEKLSFKDGPPLNSFYALWISGAAGELVNVGILVALGAIVELIDQIRWDARERNE